jgi:hypothetical protein
MSVVEDYKKALLEQRSDKDEKFRRVTSTFLTSGITLLVATSYLIYLADTYF